MSQALTNIFGVQQDEIRLLVDADARRDEIARMLGGTTKTAQAVAHAEEMLRRSRAS